MVIEYYIRSFTINWKWQNSELNGKFPLGIYGYLLKMGKRQAQGENQDDGKASSYVKKHNMSTLWNH